VIAPFYPMIKSTLLTIFLLCLGPSLPILALANSDKVEKDYYQLINLYRQRFDHNNKYHRDDEKGFEFIKAQESFQSKWTKEGYLHQLLFISNSHSKNIWVRIFVLENEQRELIAIYWDQSQYHDEEVRSYFRFRTADQLKQGLNFISLFDNYAVQVRSLEWHARNGAKLDFSFAKNLKTNVRSAQTLLLQRDSEWHLKHPA